jgi:hypothetical protein
VQKCILELIRVFEDQDHDLKPAPYTIDVFRRLASGIPLSHLTGADDEWDSHAPMDLGEIKTPAVRQNKRFHSVFWEEGMKFPYCLDAIIWNIDGTSGIGQLEFDTGEIISSKLSFDFPFLPKQFTVNVTRLDDGKFKMVDRNEYNEAVEYYHSTLNKDEVGEETDA